MTKDTRAVRRLAPIAAVFAAVAGCSSNSLLSEPGLFAYKGAGVSQSSSAIERVFQSDANRIDLDRAKSPSDRMERLRVFVDKSEVEDLSRSKIAYKPEELQQLLDKAAQESTTEFGRFERVTDRSKAQLVMRVRLYDVSAWADAKQDNSSTAANQTSTVSKLNEAVAETINREALDAYVTVLFSRPDNTEFASARALGRLVGTRGTAVTSGSYAQAQGSASGQRFLSIQNASVDETQLSRVLTAAVDGGIAVALEAQLDRDLWEDRAGKDGMRHARSAAASATPASADASSPG